MIRLHYISNLNPDYMLTSHHSFIFKQLEFQQPQTVCRNCSVMSKFVITDSSSFIGQHVLNELLQNGYQVRADLRSQEQITSFKIFFKSNRNYDNVEFVLIRELDDSSALIPYLQGIELIVHVASPTPHPGIENVTRDIIEPAIKITNSVLFAAKKIPTIRRVVITSSLSNVMRTDDNSTVVNEDSWSDAESTHDYSGCNPYEAYIASKAIVEKKVWKFVETEKPSFDIITLLMTYVFGDVLIKSDNKPSGTNALLWGTLKNGAQGGMMEQTVHVRDVADAHLRSLNAFVEGNQRFIIANDSTNFENAFELVKKEFPNETWNFGNIISTNVTYDNRKAKEVLGIKYRSFKVLF